MIGLSQRQKIVSEGGVMMNGINDELILAARLLLATLFLIFGWRKVRDYSGTVKSNVAAWPPDASPGYRHIDLHGASGCVRGRYWRIHTSLGCTHGFIRARNCAYRASLLDSERCGLRRRLTTISPLASCSIEGTLRAIE